MQLNILLGIYIYSFVAVFGACIGSFVNVVVYRLPKGVSFNAGRSRCPSCNETLKWHDLVPLFSYALLKGRCRYCGTGISLRYPLTEMASALLALACFVRFGLDGFVLSFGVSAILLAVTLIDIDTMEIPNILVLSLIPFALAAIWVFKDISLMERLIGFFAVSLPMLLLTLAIPGAFGGGDIKLIAVCGFLLGWKCVLLTFFISVLIGGGYAAYLMARGKAARGAHIAFGPYLCVGAFVSLLWGQEIIKGYLHFFI